MALPLPPDEASVRNATAETSGRRAKRECGALAGTGLAPAESVMVILGGGNWVAALPRP